MDAVSTSGQPHIDQPWQRLHRHGKVVGYSRSIGDTVYYSVDGYGWSAEAIEYDVRLPQLERNVYRTRIYHGDLVRMPKRAGAQEYSVLAILVRDDAVWVWDAETEHLCALDEVWPPPSTPRVHDVVGSIYANPIDAARIDSSFQWMLGSADPSMRDALGLASLMTIGLVLVFGFQFTVMGSVGPVTSSLAALVASILYFARRRRRQWHILRRDWMLRLSVRVGALMGLTSAVLYGGWLLNASDPVDASPVFLLCIVSVLGGLVGIISTIIGADLVAWRTSGYAGENREDSHFRELG